MLPGSRPAVELVGDVAALREENERLLARMTELAEKIGVGEGNPNRLATASRIRMIPAMLFPSIVVTASEGDCLPQSAAQYVRINTMRPCGMIDGE